MGNSRTIYLTEYTWEDIEKDAHSMNLSVSKFIDYLYSYWKEKQHRRKLYDTIIFLLLISIISLLVVVIWLVM